MKHADSICPPLSGRRMLFSFHTDIHQAKIAETAIYENTEICAKSEQVTHYWGVPLVGTPCKTE